jgi:hypothetical protein
MIPCKRASVIAFSHSEFLNIREAAGGRGCKRVPTHLEKDGSGSKQIPVELLHSVNSAELPCGIREAAMHYNARDDRRNTKIDESRHLPIEKAEVSSQAEGIFAVSSRRTHVYR